MNKSQIGRASAELSNLEMRLLYPEIPAVSEGRARADLRVLVLTNAVSPSC